MVIITIHGCSVQDCRQCQECHLTLDSFFVGSIVVLFFGRRSCWYCCSSTRRMAPNHRNVFLQDGCHKGMKALMMVLVILFHQWSYRNRFGLLLELGKHVGKKGVSIVSTAAALLLLLLLWSHRNKFHFEIHGIAQFHSQHSMDQCLCCKQALGMRGGKGTAAVIVGCMLLLLLLLL